MMPIQFPYPEQGWSTGTMRKAKLPPRQGPTQQDWIGVEGERKRKETKVSQAEPPMSHEDFADYIRQQGEVYSHHKDEYLNSFIKNLPEDMEVVPGTPKPDLTTIRVKKPALTS